MTIHYRGENSFFVCCVAQMQFGESRCQSFNDRRLEPLITGLVLQALEPASVQLSMEATESIEAERARLEKHHRQSVERAAYEAEVARRRYEEVDPSNRLVAAELEMRWEASLQVQRKCEEALSRFRQERPAKLTQEQKERITALASDFRSLWESDLTSGKDRQDLVRLLIERIEVDAIDGTERLSVAVHWSGGYTSQHETRRSVQSFDQLESADALLQRAQQLYNAGYPRAELIKRLNDEGFRPARKGRFTKTSINALMLTLRRKGMITSKPALPKPYWRSGTLADTLGIKRPTLTDWRHRDWVQTRQRGSRWIYWANEEELTRLRKLASHPASGSTPTPKELTVPVAAMPTNASMDAR